MSTLLPAFIVLCPLLIGLAVMATPEHRSLQRRSLNIGGALMTLSLIAMLLSGVVNGLDFETRLPLLPNIDFVLHGDALSLLFVSLSGLLWLFTTIYAIGYFKNSANRSRFFAFFSLCVGATIGLALAGNLVTFLIFYELLTLVTYPLIAHKGNAASIKAARTYLVYTMIGGALLLTGVVWLKVLAGPLDFTSAGLLAELPGLNNSHLQIIFVLLIAGLGVKAALFPLHAWLPISMAAPAPVSALLHAVAVVKAGAFGIVRVVYDIYGVEFASDLGLTVLLAVIAGFTIIYGSVKALSQDDLKRRLAYSTVSQVSYIALGTAIAGPIATIGGLVHLVHQGLMKITLFFCAGNLAETLGVHKISQMNGAGKRMPLTMAAFTIAAFGMIGVPPIAGFVSKWYLGVGALEAQAYWVLGVLAISSLLNASYFLPIIHAIWFKEQDQPWPKEVPKLRLETHWMLLLPPLITAFLALAVGLFASSAYSPLTWSALIASREYQAIFPDISGIALKYSTGHLWVLILPTVLLFAMAFKTLRAKVIRLIPLAPLPALLAALLVVNEDWVEQSFLLLTSAIWFIATLYAQTYMANDDKRNRFYLFFILTMIGNLGVVLSQEISSFIAFFALMSFSAYPLILHSESDEAKSAATTYIRWVIFSEIVLFLGLVGKTYYAEFGINELPVVWVSTLLIIGFGVKAGLATLHVWLPKAHPVAPIPASALLSAVMVKVGLLGWIRFLPLGDASINVLAQPMVVLGFGATFLAAIYGALQDNAKTVLAYSTVSQLGIIVASIGFALATPDSWALLLPAIVLFAMHHGFAKASLFFCVGLSSTLKPGHKLTPFLWLLVLVPALSLIGLPLSSGALAKAALKDATSSWPLFSTLLVMSAIGTTLLMCRFIELMREQAILKASSAKPNWRLILPTALSALMCLSYFYTPPFEFRQFQTIVSTLNWSSVWPAFTGLLIIFASTKLRAKLPVPPAGDLLIVYQALASLSAKTWQKIANLNASIALYIDMTLGHLHLWSLSVSRRLSKQLTLDTPGTVMIVMLAALLYTFLT
ncbi:complex I subunit 5 family protein [Colwellia sp. MB3u-4]|uniref:complex I subunit 5 family protein n=1 Tax=Colwellia sp. MB3u-4 TaxID=2759822 RepID=UPI0021754381|nr:proton-conducting transporter membrane subunit [Colwellia sp. MB3u-4]